MAETALAAELREQTGKGAARKLRAAGRIPAILYGRGKSTVPLALDPRDLEHVLAQTGLNTLIDLTVRGAETGTERVVLAKDLQRDPVRGLLLHADFYEVDLTQTVVVSVSIHLVGKARGVEMGGIVDHELREVEIECLPRAIPSFLEADVSELDVGDVLHVRDLALPEGVSLLTDGDLGVASVILPSAEEAPAAVEEVAPVEGAAAPAAAAAPEGGEGSS